MKGKNMKKPIDLAIATLFWNLVFLISGIVLLGISVNWPFAFGIALLFMFLKSGS